MSEAPSLLMDRASGVVSAPAAPCAGAERASQGGDQEDFAPSVKIDDFTPFAPNRLSLSNEHCNVLWQ
jgi:hypothetical protein